MRQIVAWENLAMKLPIYQVDAFTSRVFHGNPAAVCPLPSWLPDETLQSIALENNLSETAFLVGEGGSREIRWMTPTQEVDLCGHATLASAFVIFERLSRELSEVVFSSRSGPLWVRRQGERLVLDFPARPPRRCEPPAGLAEALGRPPLEVWAARDLMALYADEDEVRGLRPDMQKLRAVDTFAVIVTAPGREADFVSRFFGPRVGVPEDPVTGSAHCALAPYWAERLGRTRLLGYQASQRGGTVHVEHAGTRVRLAGQAVTVFTAELLA
jgi:PhzF family phenazine biosynthesis protein